MKRFLVFQGDAYYPQGGMGDFIGDFDDFDEAVKTLDARFSNDLVLIWGHVYDTEKREEVYIKQN